MSKQRYPEEFKTEAVKQITDSGHKVADVSARLGVSQHSLYQWIKAHRMPAAQRQAQGSQADELRDMDGRAIKVDSSCRTSMRNVWAIGDVTGEPMLAHRAMAQGEVAAECIAGHKRRFAPLAIPAVCFTDPEVVAVGQTQTQAAQAGIEVLTAMFPFAANGRSLTMEGGEGFVRVVARKDNHLLLGWQAVGTGVSELVAAFTYAIEMGARLEDVGGIIHAHPTLGEAIQEAALRALGKAIHV